MGEDMLYKVEYGLYADEKNQHTKYFTTLSKPDIDYFYFTKRKKEWVNYLCLKEYFPILKKWEFIFSIHN